MNRQNHPVTLLVHPSSTQRTSAALTLLQQPLCQKNGSSACLCTTCQQLREGTHHAVRWLAPEKTYTLKELEPIFEAIKFALPTGETFFFVMEHLDRLSPACGNKLLKTLEEPPAGYRFVLLASNLDNVLPTIRSRAHIVQLEGPAETPIAVHPLIEYLTRPHDQLDPLEFESTLRKNKPDLQETLQLLDQLIASVSRKILHAKRNGRRGTQNEKLLETLYHAAQTPPAQGGSDMFWKFLFMKIQRQKS